MSKFTRRVSGHCKMNLNVKFITEKFDLCFAIYELKEEETKITRKAVIERAKRNFNFYGLDLHEHLGLSVDSDDYSESRERLKDDVEALEPEFLRLFPEWQPFDEAIAEHYKKKAGVS